MTSTVDETVRSRIGRLGQETQQLFAVLAAAGGRACPDVLERVLPPEDTGRALRAGLEAGLILRDPADEAVAFRHGLIGEVVYESLTPRERRSLHARIARALTATGAPVEQLAHQWHRAGAADEALVASVESGLAATRLYAFAEARPHFERALELWPVASPAPARFPWTGSSCSRAPRTPAG